MWSTAENVLNWLVQESSWMVYAVLGLSAALEYVFPPFPGDTVAVAGAILVAAYGWGFLGVFGVVTLGSVLGAAIDFAFGARWRVLRARGAAIAGTALRERSQLDRLVDSLERRGEWYIVVNRFLPGVRALFFVAAGLAGMSFWRVMAWGAVSAGLWNALLMGAGYLVGGRLDDLEWLVSRYATATAIGLVVALGAACVWWWVRRRRQRRSPP